MASRESPDHHRMKTARSRSNGHDEARSSSLRGVAWSGRSLADSGRFIGQWIAIRRSPLKLRGTLSPVTFSSSRDLHRTARKTHGRSPRSWHDRTAIAVRSSRDRDSFMAESPSRSSEGVQWWIKITIYPRSWLDRGTIVA